MEALGIEEEVLKELENAQLSLEKCAALLQPHYAYGSAIIRAARQIVVTEQRFLKGRLRGSAGDPTGKIGE